MKYFSMFTGVGGFELGIQKAIPNAECVGFSEIDKYCDIVLKHHFKEVNNYGDAKKINTDELPEFDLLVGGFPCQSFSIAGKRKGFDDTRGTMFFEIARILKAKKPTTCVLENVKGLVNHEKGKTFRVILQTLSELGYNVEWSIFNSKHFGVPQNRERVFIIGSLGGSSRGEILPFGEDATKVQGVSGEEKTYTFKSYDGSSKEHGRAIREHKVKGESSCLTSQMGMGGNNVPMVEGMLPITAKKRTFDTPKEINQFLKDNKKEFTIREIAEKLGIQKTKAEHYFRTDGSRAIPSPELWRSLKKLLGFNDTYDKQVTEIYEKEVEYEMNRRVYSGKGLSPTLKTDVPMVVANRYRNLDGKGECFEERKDTTNSLTSVEKDNLISVMKIANCVTPDAYLMSGKRKRVDGKAVLTSAHERRLRRLTPIECERLQGFPDNWTLVPMPNGKMMSDTQRYKMCGNAVTTNVVEAVMRRLL